MEEEVGANGPFLRAKGVRGLNFSMGKRFAYRSRDRIASYPTTGSDPLLVAPVYSLARTPC
jgi:hypothetical protein